MTRRSSASLVPLLGGGLLLGLLCLAAGQLALGMGHGWDLPRVFGALSLLFYPLALLRWRWIDRETPWARDLAATALVAAPPLIGLFLFGVLPNPAYFQIEGWAIVLAALAGYLLIGWLLRAGGHALFGDLILLALALLCDGLALRDLLGPGRADGLVLALPWLLLWLGWQAVAIAAAGRHAHRAD